MWHISQKQEVIEAIEECGECLSKELKKKTAIEIINVYRNSRKLPCIKRLLRKREEIYDPPQKEIYKKLFGNIPKQYSVLDAFFEQKYIEIEHCNIIRIN